MATLSSVTTLTKTLLKLLGIGIVAILTLLIIYRLFVFVKDKITPPPPPTVSFGKLEKINFPKSKTNETLSYSIDTLTGALPVFPDRANVYETVKPSPDLLALDKATKEMNSIGFNGANTQISETLYQWTENNSNSSLERKIVYDIFSRDFNLSSTFLFDSKVLAGNNLPNETAAINTAQNFLSNLSSFPEDIDTGKTITTLLSIKNGILIPEISLSNTQIVRVSFFQKNLGELPVVYKEPNFSNINIFVGGGDSSPQIVKADFFHHTIASKSATYPLITSTSAFDKLKKGDAYIASFNGEDKKISINEIFLAYYLSDQAQNHVMPVVVFKGNNDFTAYVSAIKDEWIQN